MRPERYALFICLCAVDLTPEKEYIREIRDIDEDYDDYTPDDFVYKVRTAHGHHYASKKDVQGWLDAYGSTPQGFWGEKKAKYLGF